MSNTPDLKGSSFTLSVLHLSDNHITNTIDFLKQKIAQAPAFFANAPVVINIAKVDGDIDFVQLKNGISEANLIPVGISGCKDKRSQTLASEAGFAVMTASNSPTNAPAKMAPTKVVRTPIRSGQQVYAKDGDLVILNHVSAGAEVIADGSIHIHGTLRGRAIAGASGQKEARIICHDLQAELVSIAGNYWLSDQIESEFWQQKVMLSMNDDSLLFESLAI
ncbi:MULTISPECIES: septum site-determining protein MinC [Vibrio]|uniref:Probable septum site-determining protein MinC n=1 Tax=Vibrio diazotrophicus TaxID=685 RepID=A0A2J8HTK5_VIBDI|nr:MULTISPECIES: septum site-determining protein MinC [Vibrio]MCF7362665.1 septum site-determining protein MinC [Vibrio sp. A1-b2]MCZ4371867.1 septum site-determining protein MinC [Vibrio diazotrophicus]PNH80062.1 septum site-determining protein MinC [Vibrio diazotrophicus]PNI01614.1 septum site-determining protein MinC [Vibrio diazotrophicus]PNI06232.1 septum site-determining protein MinC [Vibrio diazotrophicus]